MASVGHPRRQRTVSALRFLFVSETEVFRRERDWVLAEFKGGRSPILIATDVASRGLGTCFRLMCIGKGLSLPLDGMSFGSHIVVFVQGVEGVS